MKKILLLSAALLLAPSFSLAQSPFPSSIQLKSTQVANNTTAVVIKATPGIVFGIEAFNSGTSVAFLKLYNATSATCGSGTPFARYMIPAMAANAFGGVLTVHNSNGDAYGLGIVQCVTTGYADSDTGAPAATTFIVNVHFK